VSEIPNFSKDIT